MTQPAPRKSDLGVRVVSAVVMVAVAGTALWLGGGWWAAFVLLVATGVLWEWWGLVQHFAGSPISQILWVMAGLVYVGVAALALMSLREGGLWATLLILASVIAVDIGAYFAGRGIGGPKIAPAISPSKTWAGLGGGIVAASATLIAFLLPTADVGDPGLTPADMVRNGILFGIVVAVVAQVGDFFESWMKRRAGVKDSGTVIPGHGGLFDRVDGLMAVLFLIGLAMAGLLTAHMAAGGELLPSPA